MKMIKILLILSSLTFSYNAIATNSEQAKGEMLFKNHCAVCHGAGAGQMDMNKRIAPPIAAVRMHYIGHYPDEASFVQAISSWVKNQDPAKSKMRGAIRRFGIMPPISVAEKDVALIASFIHTGNIEKPKGFKEHVNEQHKNGKGLGRAYSQ